ncbi:MAG: PASTA domain-containing protein, partial [Acidimicrobiaceae bacterium]|nr:PASTA domain-containing protein [Acidimicrobiaceae bacterium]
MAGFLRGRHARAGLLVAVVVAVVAAAFGTAYKTTRAVASDDSAWLRKGITIAHINGPSGRDDAVVSTSPQLAGSRTDPLEVIQDPSGQVYTADKKTGKVFRINLNDMTPEPGPSGTAVVSGGGKVYVVNARTRTVTPVNPNTLVPGKSIRISAAIESQAAGPDGTVYIGENDGAVTTIDNGRAHTTRVAPSHDPVSVAVVGSSPVAVDPVAGTVRSLSGSQKPIQLPARGQVEMEANQPAGPLWLVAGSTQASAGSSLVSVDVNGGRVVNSLGLGTGAFDAPAVNAGRVYVPDESAGQVRVFGTSPVLQQVSTINVPAGASGDHTIEVVVRGGEVWIDNPTSQFARAVSANGQVQLLNKGTGDQVVNPNAKPAPTRRRTPASPAAAASAPPHVSPSPPPVSSVPAVPAAFTPQPNLTPTHPVSSPAPVVVAPSAFGAAGPAASPSPAPRPTTPGAVQHQPPTPGTTTTTQPKPTTTTQPNPTTTTQPQPAQPKVPGGLVGLNDQSACTKLQTYGLQCAVSYVAQGTATQPDIVASTTPAPGTSVAKGSTVTLTVDETQVPAVSGQDPSTYCQQADALGFACSPQDVGPGTPTGVVLSTSVTGYQRPGTPVAAQYHGANWENCVGLLVSQCPNGADYTVAGNPVTDPSVACDVIDGESGSGTTLTVNYNSYCAQEFGEWHRTDTVTSASIWYEGFVGNGPPS